MELISYVTTNTHTPSEFDFYFLVLFGKEASLYILKTLAVRSRVAVWITLHGRQESVPSVSTSAVTLARQVSDTLHS